MDLNNKNILEQGEPEPEPSPLDEFKEFLVELWDLLKQDFSNSINFISSNKHFFTTAALLAILLQVSSVSYLGASFEKYCGSRDMRGGGGEPQVITYQDYKAAEAQEKVEQKAEAVKAKREEKIQKQIDKKSGKKASKMMAANQKKGVVFSQEHYQAKAENAIKQKAKGNEDAAALKKGKDASIAEYKAKADEARDNDKLMKANKERISFFEDIKNKFNSTLSPGSIGGPLFGRLDLIFDSIKHVFYIIAIILTIAGVVSLPVLFFLIITYYVFKTMISKFIIL
jgi:hypothetical protein